jgi:hypothetical protein
MIAKLLITVLIFYSRYGEDKNMSPHKAITTLKLADCSCMTILSWMHDNERYYTDKSYPKECYKMYTDVSCYLVDNWEGRTIDHCLAKLESIWNK